MLDLAPRELENCRAHNQAFEEQALTNGSASHTIRSGGLFFGRSSDRFLLSQDAALFAETYDAGESMPTAVTETTKKRDNRSYCIGFGSSSRRS